MKLFSSQTILQSIQKAPKVTWVFLVFLIFALGRAVYFRWVCDDAFISFRYAKNLIDGLGLVFNEGEYVEGYTNFLWTLGISLGMLLRIDPLRWVQFFGILSYALSLGFLYYLSYSQYRIREESKHPLFYFPLAALCLSVQTHAQIYATGGLETSIFGMFLVLGYGILLIKADHRYLLLANIFLILAALTRPEGLLFAGWGVLFVFLFRLRKQPSNIVQTRILFTLFPFLAIYLPYFFWRWEYYGKVFPNTYYAKYGHGEYFSQGIKYLTLYLNSYYVFYALLLLFILFFLKFLFYFNETRKVREFKRRRLSSKTYRDQFESELEVQENPKDSISEITENLILFFIPTLLYVFYLVRIGGDFMFARLLISVSPLLFYSLESLWVAVFTGRVRLISGIIIVTATFFSINPYRGLRIPVIENITSENDIYKLKDIYAIKNALVPLREVVRESGLNIAFGGAEAMFAYYLNPRIAIETASGLTDSYIANRPVKERSKVGHEKKVPLEYLRNRNVHIHFDPESVPRTSYNSIKIINLPYEYRIVTYDSNVFKILKESKKFEFLPFEEYLDKYIANLHKIKIDRIRRDYFKFQKYYFNWNDDPEREDYLRSEK
jgi:hypothetical protein